MLHKTYRFFPLLSVLILVFAISPALQAQESAPPQTELEAAPDDEGLEYSQLDSSKSPASFSYGKVALGGLIGTSTAACLPTLIYFGANSLGITDSSDRSSCLSLLFVMTAAVGIGIGYFMIPFTAGIGAVIGRDIATQSRDDTWAILGAGSGCLLTPLALGFSLYALKDANIIKKSTAPFYLNPETWVPMTSIPGALVGLMLGEVINQQFKENEDREEAPLDDKKSASDLHQVPQNADNSTVPDNKAEAGQLF